MIKKIDPSLKRNDDAYDDNLATWQRPPDSRRAGVRGAGGGTGGGRGAMGSAWERAFSLQAEDGIRDVAVTGVQTCALPIFLSGTHTGAAQLSVYDECQSDYLGC